MRFEAEIESAGTDGRWKIIYIPFRVEDAFGSRGQVKVKGTVNGFPFTSSLFPNGKGQHFLMINKAMQRGGHTGEPGATVAIELEAERERKIVVPPALKQALAKNAAAKKCFAGLPPGWQGTYICRVTSARSPEVQARRAKVCAEKLGELGRALEDPPAIVKSTLATSPVARERFAKLSPSHRREYFAYILDAVSVETRRSRARKMLQKLLAS